MKKRIFNEFSIKQFSNICKLVLVISLVIGTWNLIFTPTVTLAADSSSSANLSDELKVKLKTLQEEIASRAAKLKLEVGSQLRNKAYVGIVKSTSDDSLIIATKAGSKIVTINNYTDYISIPKSKKAIKGVVQEDYIAALGDIDDNEVLTAQRIVKMAKPSQNSKTIIWGRISALSGQTLTIKTRDQGSLTFTFNDNTDFQQGKAVATSQNLQTGGPVIVVGSVEEDGIYQASLIYLFPSNKPSPTLTPKTTATPSAKPKKTLK